MTHKSRELVGLAEDSSPEEGFGRRPSTDVRIQSLLNLGQPFIEDLFEDSDVSVDTPLHEDTWHGLRRVELINWEAIIPQIAFKEGLRGVALFDMKWRELLASNSDDGFDVEHAARLALGAMPKLPQEPLIEIVTMTTSHYELIHYIQEPLVSAFCYTFWDRRGINLALTTASIREILAKNISQRSL